jgi:hypothetical protein
VTVSAEWYEILQNFLVDELHNRDLPVWFQQIGAIAHSAWIGMEIVCHMFSL